MHCMYHHFLIIAYAGFSSMITLFSTTRLYAPHVFIAISSSFSFWSPCSLCSELQITSTINFIDFASFSVASLLSLASQPQIL